VRLCVVVPTLQTGGAERVVVTMLQHLDRARFETTLVVIDGRNSELLSEVPADIPVQVLGSERLLYAIPRLTGALWRLQPQVIFSVIGHLNVTLVALRPLLPRGLKLVTRESTMVSSGLPEGLKGSLVKLSYGLFYRWSHRIVCQTEEMKADFVLTVAGTATQCVVIPNPLDVSRVRRLAAAKLSSQDGLALEDRTRPLLVAVGRLSLEKGFDLLVRAVALVGDPALRVIVIGEGPERNSLEALSRDLGVSNQLAFIGYRKNSHAFVGRSDGFVLCSRVEGLPNAVLEALCLGVPVIALPAIGVTRRLLAGRPQCWVADQASAEALAAKIMQWRSAGSVKRQEHDLFEFSASAVTEQFQQLFETLVGPAS
jgi:glycosyltransferase involved in cell wall biosynthesis